jgi:hypothetical protein
MVDGREKTRGSARSRKSRNSEEMRTREQRSITAVFPPKLIRNQQAISSSLIAGSISLQSLSAAFHKYGEAPRRRGARLARREEGAYREYLTDEQRREAGCIAGRMPPYL